MTSVWLLLVVQSAWSTVPTTGNYHLVRLLYPDDGQAIHLEDYLWVETDQNFEHTFDVVGDGEYLPIEVHGFGRYHLVSTAGGWMPDVSYTLAIDGDDFPFRAVDGTTAVATPPVAVRRTVWADEAIFDPYYAGWFTWSGAEVTVCEHDLFAVSAIGGVEPAVPAVDDGIDWLLHGATVQYTSEDRWSDGRPGGTTTLWFGTVDAAGRFGGWIAEPIELPGSQEKRSDYRAGVDGTTTLTWDVCPTGDWILGDVEHLEGIPGDTGDDEGGGGVDVAHDDRVGDGGCGCASGGWSAAWIWLLLVPGLRARSRASAV